VPVLDIAFIPSTSPENCGANYMGVDHKEVTSNALKHDSGAERVPWCFFQLSGIV
jgi:hypothetical protein